MNKVVLVGRLTADPQLKYTAGAGTAVTTFTLAVDRQFKNKDGQREADFINCVVWSKLAEVMANNLSKGRQIAVSGRIQTRNYDGKDGKKVYVTEVIVEDFQFLDKKDADNTTAKPTTTNNKPANNADFIPDNDSDDMPF